MFNTAFGRKWNLGVWVSVFRVQGFQRSRFKFSNFFLATVDEEAVSVTSKHVTRNPRNENPRSLRQSSRLDHRTLGRPNLPRETVRKYVRWPQTRIPPDPCQFSAGVEGGRFLTRLRQKGPSSAHFTGENNQSGSCVCPRELLISSLFSLAGLTQRSAVKWTATQAEAR